MNKLASIRSQAYSNGHMAGFTKGVDEGFQDAYHQINDALKSITKYRNKKFKVTPRICMRCAKEVK